MDESRQWLTRGLVVSVALFSLLFFFQTKDPMILVFGVIAAVILWSLLARGGRWVETPTQIRVRCTACRALNLEDAKFCSSCGRAL